MLIKNILIGEDIRQEVGNKISLMGIVGDSLNMTIPANTPKDTPVSLALAFLVTMESDDPKKDPKSFDVLVEMHLGSQHLGKMDAKMTSTGNDRVIHLSVPKLGLLVTESSTFSISAQITKDGKLLDEGSAILNIGLNREDA